MNDAFINALNTQKSTDTWINALTQNMSNMYTPGYRESALTFKTFLTGSVADSYMKNTGQGKSIPGTSSENVFLEVRTANFSAQALYKKMGFIPVAIRKKYYDDGEDAIVMVLPLDYSSASTKEKE